MSNYKTDWGSAGFPVKPFKTAKTGMAPVPPNSGADGRVIGSGAPRKGLGASRDSIIRHAGIVGGSPTTKKPSVSKPSIDKLPNNGRTRVIGGK